MKYLKIIFLGICLNLFFTGFLTAKQRALEETFSFAPSEYYQRFLASYQLENWKWAQFYGKEFLSAYPASPFASETRYLLAETYFKQNDFELANYYFSQYLKYENNPKHFEETIRYKFEIAKAFEEGAKKHIWGQEVMPKWIPAKDEALAIYDEIITTFPRNDLAAEAMFRKAGLLKDTKEFKSSVETYQNLIRRFPKNPLAPESYLQIAAAYLEQSRSQFPDPASLDLADINLRKFQMDFPGDPRIEDIEKTLMRMKNTFAKELYETAKYYERVKKIKAASIYYCSILIRYPNTKFAKQSQERLDALGIDMDSFLGKKAKAEINEKILVETEDLKES